ncbi:hypothetical protein [Streptomyces sp. KN37]|uniref:hypothetical protein n=1 Tax=Streptomyces sp. KN37 TaxID=3090667 RepID=UPI002A74FDEF|nr:hypothetical protein [Streptomyces sp. KN37]WPO72909.1 hypothetical protein R9806_20880 [Streptomyces sp. KN37]
MKCDIFEGLGVVLLVLGAQGAIRRLIDHDDAGLLGWLPGGFAAGITLYVLALVIGAVVAGRAHGAAKAAGRLSVPKRSGSRRCL